MKQRKIEEKNGQLESKKEKRKKGQPYRARSRQTLMSVQQTAFNLRRTIETSDVMKRVL
jgi:hypothetical protein